MNKGTVKFFNVSKGFGFIKDADSDNEYFVHVSGLKDQIKENDEVTRQSTFSAEFRCQHPGGTLERPAEISNDPCCGYG